MQKISSVIESNDEFKKFYEEAISSDIFNPEVFEVFDVLEEKRRFEIELTESQRKSIKNANDRLIRAANDICLAFEERNRKLLSLGDLSESVLNNLFRTRYNKSKYYCVIRSAHHGTHFPNHPNTSNIASCVVIHPNGVRMSKFYKEAYLNWSDNQHHTFFDDCFDWQFI